MVDQMPEVKIPGYMERAITSRLAQTEPYSWLSPEQWRDLTEHVYRDEVIPVEETGVTFLQRGTQNAYGHGRRQTLNGILDSVIHNHSGVTSQVPHYRAAKTLYELISAAEELRPYLRGFNFTEMRE